MQQLLQPQSRVAREVTSHSLSQKHPSAFAQPRRMRSLALFHSLTHIFIYLYVSFFLACLLACLHKSLQCSWEALVHRQIGSGMGALLLILHPVWMGALQPVPETPSPLPQLPHMDVKQ